MTTVFVSGATGFIAIHIVKVLLDKNYTVIGSVRSAEKGDALAKQLGSSRFSYEVVPDIAKEGAFDDALQNHPEIKVFLHTASPFHFKATDVEEELLKPAVGGTTNALKAITKYGGQIENVVITSSYAAVSTSTKEKNPAHTNNEESWNEITWDEALVDSFAGYRGSKKFAEKAAWDYVKENKVNFKINYINPSFVFGPQAFPVSNNELNTSSEVINSFLKLSSPNDPIPSTAGGFVDVRDVAKAHLVAFEHNLQNQRLILNAGRFNSQTILDVLHENFPELDSKLPVGTPGSDKEELKQYATIDNSKTKQILGFPLIGIKETVVDSVKQILNN
ncbi:NAD(P)-binding protein [Hyphopichia burtonii NRRL Y-1933]|uniref:NAD(P)-binding protein n=1 Tax=Hyphopichia burtonii NRRL Y-1933 TaxID=984485 RepID=A0A1E4RFP9_9ASCO|nr:NAD(P)-binding protein [Hyphopichia burtonii NRRL Y-1933]ODV66092.1 NAD(P)-binding protein [Hyphopichia burtonii NRRL Y-1933]